MAVVKRYVNTDSTAGGDGTTNATTGANRAYATLNEWESAEQADLVTDGDIAEVECSGSAVDSGWCDVNGWTTGASNYIDIYAADGSRCNGLSRDTDANVFRSTGFWELFEDYCRFTGIEFNRATTVIMEDATGISVANDTRITDCIFHTHTAGSTGNAAVLFSKASRIKATFKNVLFVTRGRALYTLGAGATIVDHAVAWTPSGSGGGYGFLCETGDTITNTYAGTFGTNDFYTGSGDPSGSNNASADATGDDFGTGSLINKAAADQFENPTLVGSTWDFTLKTGNVLEDAGTGSLANDIAGTAYPSPSDIGVFSSGAAPAGTNITGTTAALTLAAIAAVVTASVTTNITGTTAALTLTPQTAAVTALVNTSITGTTAALTLTPQAADVTLSTNITGTTAALTLTPQAADVTLSTNITGTTAALTLTPQPGVVSTTSPTFVTSPAPAALTLTPIQAGVMDLNTQFITGVAASLVLTPNVAVVSDTQTSAITAVNTPDITATPQAASVSLDPTTFITGILATLSLTPQAATVVEGSNTEFTATTASMTLTPQTALVANSRVINGITANLSLTAQNATVNAPIQATTAALYMRGQRASLGGVHRAGLTTTTDIPTTWDTDWPTS